MSKQLHKQKKIGVKKKIGIYNVTDNVKPEPDTSAETPRANYRGVWTK